MELFKLFGKIAISNIDANKAIDETTDKGKSAEHKLSNHFNKIGEAAKKVGKVMIAGFTAGAVALGKLTKDAIDSYGDYEQLVGGVETLFKNSSQKVIEYANSAYKTAGLSANDYMETVTSFSASLLQSLNNDTAKSAEYANRAITDMADNSNKMGTSMESIQNAYNGFAKQNYTMLDNLKLGYGGTKEEMARLIKDAAKLKDVQKELGVTVDSNSMSFGNIVNAISVVQKKMDIMGTTSKEASTTIQGSISSMKASWQNLLTGLADENQNFDVLMDNFVNSVGTVLKNISPRIKPIFLGVLSLIYELLPQVGDIIKDFLSGLISDSMVLVNEIPILIPTIFQKIGSKIQGAIPLVTQKVSEFMINIGNMMKNNLPTIISKGLDMIEGLVDTIAENLPKLITSGMDMLKNIIQGLMNALPELIARVPVIITKIANLINDNMPTILQKGFEIIVMIINGIVQAIPTLIASIPQIIQAIVAVWEAMNWLELGGKLITGIKNGITGMFTGFKSFITDSFNGIKEGIKNIFTGTASESTSIWKNIFNVIKNIINNLKSTAINIFNNMLSNVKNIFSNIKNAIQHPIQTAVNFVKSGIDKMKGFLKFSWELPKLKMPHFKISGNFSLNPPSVPSFGIEWYKQGGLFEGIMTEPTLMGFNAKTGNATVGGEAGTEVAAPLDKLLGMIRQVNSEDSSILLSVLEKIYNLLIYYMPEIQKHLQKGRVIQMDGGALVGAIIDDVDQALDEKLYSKRRGN